MAAEDRNENIEEKTRKIAKKEIPQGEELQSFQEAQNHLLQIEAARKQNIQVDRAVTSAQSQNNQTLAQAADMVATADGGGDYGGPVQGRAVRLNPQTQAILGKYGYGRPRTERSTQVSSGPVQGRGIIINNKTENNTTNNVQVSTPPSPIIQQKSNSEGGMAKFKAWLAGSFNKQKAQDTIRERNYKRQEWSLSRSSKKIMEKLEEVGKTIGERMDPRKIANIFMDQMKVLFFLLGFQFLSKNWKNILEKVAVIEKWIKKQAEYFGFFSNSNERGKRSQFVKDLISFLGGDPNSKEGALGVLRNLFKDAVKLLGERFKMFMADRADAVKAIKFPTINPEDGILGGLSSLGKYLADILAAIVGGRSGIEQNVRHQIQAAGKAEAMGVDAEGSRGWIRKKGRFENAIGINNTDQGDLSSLTDNRMASYDYDSSGNLANNTTSSLTQSNSIAGMIGDETTAKIHTVGVMSGFEQLANSVDRNGYTLITQEFIDSLKELMPRLNWKMGKKLPYKFVKVKKTDEDFRNEGADYAYAGASAFTKRSGINALRDAAGAHGVGSNIVDYAFTGDVIKDPGWQGLKAAGKAALKRLGSNDYTLKLVPANDPRPGVEVEYYDQHGADQGKKNLIKKQKWFYLYKLTPQSIELIRQKLAATLNNPDFQFDTSSKSSMESLENLLRQIKKRKLQGKKRLLFGANKGRGKQDGFYSDYDEVKNTYEDLDEYDRAHEQREKRWRETYENSQTAKFVDNVGEGITALADYGADYLGLDYHKPIPITEKLSRQNAITAMNYFINREGFTKEQAAGMVGSLMAESTMNPTAVNEDSGAYGLAQWLGDRKKRLFAMYGSNPTLENQLKYISYELRTTHTKGKTALLNARTAEEAADAAFGRFEFSAGVDGAVAEMENHNQDGLGRKRKGRHLAQDVLLTYNNSGEAAEREWENSRAGYYKEQIENSPLKPKDKIPNYNYFKRTIKTPKKKRSSNSDNNIRIPFKAPKRQTPDYTKPKWGSGSFGIQAYTSEAARKTKESKGNDSIIEELKRINNSVESQGNNLAMLSARVGELTTVAATNGNNTTIINNGNGDKLSAPNFTQNPNSWTNTGYYNSITT